MPYYLNPKTYNQIFYGGMKSGKTALTNTKVAMVKELLQNGIDAWDQKLAEEIFQASKNSLSWDIETPQPGTIGAIEKSTHPFWTAQQWVPSTQMSLMEFLLDT